MGTKIVRVTVGSKTSAHPFAGGSSSAYFLDGHESPTLFLLSGTYVFDQADSSNNGHPFRFYYDPERSNQYNNVTTAGSEGNPGAYTQITIDSNTPAPLYYQCSAHGYMGGRVESNSYGNYVTGSTADFVTDSQTGDFITNGMTGNFVDATTTGYLVNLGGGGGGETNTSSNLGAGTGLFSGKIGVDFGFKSIKQAGGIELIESADKQTITISGATGGGYDFGAGGGGGGGETNTSSNVGVGSGLFSGKAGVDFQFKSLKQAGIIEIVESASKQTLTISGQRVGTGDLTSTGQVTFGTGADLLFISDTGIHFGLVPTVNQSGMVLTGSAPATDNAAGIPGQISFDSTHFYVYVETGWKRSALSAW